MWSYNRTIILHNSMIESTKVVWGFIHGHRKTVLTTGIFKNKVHPWNFWKFPLSKSSYGHLKFAQKWRPGPFWANNWSYWPHFLGYGLQICFCPLFTLILMVKSIQQWIRPKLAIVFHKNRQKMYKNGYISVRVFSKMSLIDIFPWFIF